MLKILILFGVLVFTSTASEPIAEEYRPKTQPTQEVLKYVLKYGLGGHEGVGTDSMTRAGLCEKPETPSCEDFFGDADPSCFEDRTSCEMNDLGKCKLWWQDSCKCDFIEWNRCGESSNTFCCIECRNDISSECTRQGGECRKTCARFHEAVNATCTSPSCSCCSKCESVSCEEAKDGSQCVTSASFCLHGYYADPDSCSGDCVCCRPCLASQECIDNHGYPENVKFDCKTGYEASYVSGSCKCCKPEGQALCLRNGERNMGPADFCIPEKCPPNYYEYQTGCSSNTGEDCRCCEAGGWQRCLKGKTCADDDGCCTSSECPCSGYRNVTEGCDSRDDVACTCCVHECKLTS